MHGRVRPEQRHLERAGCPYLELLHALVLLPWLRRTRLGRAEVQQEAHAHPQPAPERGEARGQEHCQGGGKRPARGGLIGGRAVGRAGALDEGGVRGGDGLGGEVEVVDAHAREEEERVYDGCGNEYEGHRDGLAVEDKVGCRKPGE